MIKLLALDLDGTCLNWSNKITLKTMAALKKAAQQGVEIVFITGRSYASMPYQLKKESFFRYIISSNGVVYLFSQVYSNTKILILRDGTRLFHVFLCLVAQRKGMIILMRNYKAIFIYSIIKNSDFAFIKIPHLIMNCPKMCRQYNLGQFKCTFILP